MKYGMPTLIENNDLEEAASLCKELGFDFVEINMNLPQYQIEYLEDTDYLQRLADKYSIFYTIHLEEHLNICDFNKEVANAYLKTVERVIKVAKILRVPIINMHMNKGVYVTLPDKKIYLYSKYNKHYMSRIKEYRIMCEELIGDSDVKISIENTDGYTDFEKEAIKFLLESQVFSLTWDIGHSHATKNMDEAFLMEHVDKLSHFHIHDGYGKQNHMTLGSGEIDINSRLLLAKQYNCRCVIETKTIDALKKSVMWLKNK